VFQGHSMSLYLSTRTEIVTDLNWQPSRPNSCLRLGHPLLKALESCSVANSAHVFSTGVEYFMHKELKYFWVQVICLFLGAFAKFRKATISFAVLYCHIWPVWLYYIFPHYLINGTIFGKKVTEQKCVFWCSLQYLPEIFLILRRIQRDIIINVHRSSCKVPVIFVRF
jgi:hypothetical protein